MQLLTGEQADEMGDHQDGNDNRDHLDERVGQEGYFIDFRWLALTPIGKADNGKCCTKNHDCKH